MQCIEFFPELSPAKAAVPELSIRMIRAGLCEPVELSFLDEEGANATSTNDAERVLVTKGGHLAGDFRDSWARGLPGSRHGPYGWDRSSRETIVLWCRAFQAYAHSHQ